MSVLASVLIIISMAASLSYWNTLHKARPDTMPVMLGAVLGAVMGSKLGFCLSEAAVLAHDPQWMEKVLVGKTVIGGILGGYIGVELAKHLIGYREITGDLFAQIAPMTIALGRIGCIVNRCCPGKSLAASWYTITHDDGSTHWPAAEIELSFNLLAALVFMILRRRNILRGQHFHLYMISYGLFRVCHEYMRDEHPLVGAWTGYQALSLLLFGSGLFLFIRRRLNPVVTV